MAVHELPITKRQVKAAKAGKLHLFASFNPEVAYLASRRRHAIDAEVRQDWTSVLKDDTTSIRVELTGDYFGGNAVVSTNRYTARWIPCPDSAGK